MVWEWASKALASTVALGNGRREVGEGLYTFTGDSQKLKSSGRRRKSGRAPHPTSSARSLDSGSKRRTSCSQTTMELQPPHATCAQGTQAAASAMHTLCVPQLLAGAGAGQSR